MAEGLEKYQAAVDSFNETFGLSFSFEEFESSHIKLVKFFKNNGQLSLEDNLYRGTLLSLYRETVENNMKGISKAAAPDELFSAFEVLMENYREYCKGKKMKAPSTNGGWDKKSEAFESMREKISDIPESKSDYIKNLYLDGKYPLRRMRADLEAIQGKTSITSTEASRLLVYVSALEDTISNRSRGWRANPFNWVRKRAEKRDLATLRAFIDTLKRNRQSGKLFNLADKAMRENVIAKSNEQINTAIGNERALEIQRQTEHENFIKSAPTNAENAKKLFAEKDFADKLKRNIFNLIDDPKVKSPMKNDPKFRSGWVDQFYNKVTAELQSMWDGFDAALSPENKEKAIANGAKKLFVTVQSHMGLLQMEETDKYIDAQKITDSLLGSFSPIAANKEYESYKDKYYLKNITPEDIIDDAPGSNYYNEAYHFFTALLNDIRSRIGEGNLPKQEDKIKFNYDTRPTKSEDFLKIGYIPDVNNIDHEWELIKPLYDAVNNGKILTERNIVNVTAIDVLQTNYSRLVNVKEMVSQENGIQKATDYINSMKNIYLKIDTNLATHNLGYVPPKISEDVENKEVEIVENQKEQISVDDAKSDDKVNAPKSERVIEDDVLHSAYYEI